MLHFIVCRCTPFLIQRAYTNNRTRILGKLTSQVLADPRPCATQLLGHPLLHAMRTPTRCHIKQRHAILSSMGHHLATWCCKCTIGPKVQHLAPHRVICQAKNTTHQDSCQVQHTMVRNIAPGTSACLGKLQRARMEVESFRQWSKGFMGPRENIIHPEPQVGGAWDPAKSEARNQQNRLRPHLAAVLFVLLPVRGHPPKEVHCATAVAH